MLVLSRKIGEKIMISDTITLIVGRVVGNRVSLGIDAPAEVPVVRGELRQRDESRASNDPAALTAREARSSPAR